MFNKKATSQIAFPKKGLTLWKINAIIKISGIFSLFKGSVAITVFTQKSNYYASYNQSRVIRISA